MATVPIKVTVNGVEHSSDIEPRLLLVHYLRETLRLTGTHIGCDTSHCGACTVVMDGRAVKSCTVFAVQADGRSITTVGPTSNRSRAAAKPIPGDARGTHRPEFP